MALLAKRSVHATDSAMRWWISGAAIVLGGLACGRSELDTGIDAAAVGCTDYCAHATAEGCDRDEDGCVVECLEEVRTWGPCVDDFLTVLACTTDKGYLDVPACVEGMCEEEVEQLTNCTFPAGDCETGQCVAGFDNNVCVFPCGDIVYSYECTSTPQGEPAACSCFIDDQPIGMCEQFSNLSYSCCKQFFATSG